MTLYRESRVAAMVLIATGCLSSPDKSNSGGADGALLPCAVNSDAGVSVSGPPYCYPESTKPSGACSNHTPTCGFCGYPPCPVGSGLIEPHTYYECSCTAGAWSCGVVRQFGTDCAPVLSCLGPDGGLAVSCISGAGVSCQMNDASGPVCVLAGGTTPTPCGNDSCAIGCTCADPVKPACACQ